ncbi:MurR/RpiR family transcriptional regulator [Pisciglobus halotolerans]|uniref:Transcriptional regulator, RpiR family n=1 Tax=Pisciglobus halotolerans TaxID=745365 RepID=A0A1I3DI60_9LACT|nr:MurR/RpiR family transcriptional regulator [Pisciglobus halotolerans]SFH86427.1 transcriptional regulator, RpiR family [Pisciglobus halotolerans]
MDLEARVNHHYSELNENDMDIVSYILKNKRSVENMTITSLAKLTLTSKSSILRLAKKLGYSGYSEFKYDLRNQLKKDKNEEISVSFTDLQDNEIENTKKLFKQTELEPILEELHGAKRIFCYGTGWGQRDVLSNFNRCLIPLNKFPVLLSSLTEFEMVSHTITEEDLLIVVSLSGDIKEAKDVMQALEIRNIPILSITDLRNNGYASLATYNLYFQVNSFDYKEEEIVSLLPIYIATDLLYRKYTEYVMRLEQKELLI